MKHQTSLPTCLWAPGPCDSCSTFSWMHIHYTHGQWCRRRGSKSALSSLDRLRSTGFTSGATTKKRIYGPQQQDRTPGNHLPALWTNEFQICFISLLSLPSSQPGDIAQHDAAKTLRFHYRRPRERCLEFMNTAFWFHSWNFHCVFVSCGRACVCVHTVGASFSFICISKLSGSAVPHWAGNCCFPFISQIQRRVTLLLSNTNLENWLCYFPNM